MTQFDDTGTRKTGSLLGDALSHVSALVRNEFDLARAEIGQNVSRAGTAIGLLVGAVVIGLTALNVLSGAVVAAMTEAGMHPGWAAFLIGGALGLVTAVLISKGTNDLKLSSLAPTRTEENLRRDAEAIKGATQDA